MKKQTLKKLVAAVSLIVATGGTAYAQDYKTIRTMGISNPVCEGGINNPAELQKYVTENREDFINMVSTSGWPGDSDALISAITAGDFNDVMLPIGTEFEWMGVRRRTTGDADTVTKLRWGGDAPVDAYSIETVSNGKVYTFVIPKVCCNLAMLTQVKDAPVVPAVLVAEAVGDSPASSGVLPFIAPFIGYENRVRDECPEDAGESYGDGHQTKNDGAIAGAILGLLKPLNDRTSLLAQLGGAYNFNKSKYSTAFADIGLNQKVGDKGFLGGGIGIWDINDSANRDGSFFIQGGVDAFETSKGKAQWFAEARALFDKPGDNTIFMTGLRFLFDQ